VPGHSAADADEDRYCRFFTPIKHFDRKSIGKFDIAGGYDRIDSRNGRTALWRGKRSRLIHWYVSQEFIIGLPDREAGKPQRAES
jgi:hypothetical protein